MNKSLEPDLHNLLSSLAGPLPPELLDLATSLVAQSRTRISNLKPAEEIARSYACAHLACLRLKNHLNLPSITPSPPLPKRAYDSLLSHFQKSLLTTAPAAPTVADPTPSRLPADLAQNLTALCSRLNTPTVLPHLLIGVASILDAPEHSRARTSPTTVYAIAVAVTILTIERLSPHSAGVAIGNVRWVRGVGYKAKQREVMACLGPPGKGVTKGSVDGWIQKLSNQGFRRWEWMVGIPDAGGVGVVEEEAQTKKKKGRSHVGTTGVKKGVEKKDGPAAAPTTTKRKAEVEPPRRLEPKRRLQKGDNSAGGGGGGRMLQDRVNYLTDQRRKQFEAWKPQVLARCCEIEAAAAHA